MVPRKISFYSNHFQTFYASLGLKVQNKIDDVLELIATVEIVPSKFLRQIEGKKGLFEIRVEYSSNIYRIFCCFDKGNLVILFHGFQKKSQKTPKEEIEKAEKLKDEYFKR